MNISVTPNAVAQQEGAAVKIVGSGFTPNSTGSIQTVDNTLVATYKADANGNFKFYVKYSTTPQSNLMKALGDCRGQNFIAIVAWDTNTSQISNEAYIYF
jgi:hypothetical protein